jgi:hypothetical protein
VHGRTHRSQLLGTEQCHPKCNVVISFDREDHDHSPDIRSRTSKSISAILGDPGIRGIRACDLAISTNQEIASALGKYPTPFIAGVSVLVRRGRKWHAEQPNRHTGWTVQANCDRYYGVK